MKHGGAELLISIGEDGSAFFYRSDTSVIICSVSIEIFGFRIMNSDAESSVSIVICRLRIMNSDAERLSGTLLSVLYSFW